MFISKYRANPPSTKSCGVHVPTFSTLVTHVNDMDYYYLYYSLGVCHQRTTYGTT